MSRIHFVGGEKGGVGKSVFAGLLCHWFSEHSVPLAALDADASQGALLRCCPAHCRPEHCRGVDLSVFASADQIMDRALTADREVVVDLPAKSLRHLSKWLQESDVASLATEMGVRLVHWHVTDGGFDSLQSLEQSLNRLPSSVPVVVVCNQRWVGAFSELESSAIQEKLRDRGGQTIELPSLDPQLMYETERLGGHPATVLSEAPTEGAGLTPMQRRRVTHWMQRAYAQMEPILSQEVPSAETPRRIEEPLVESVSDEPANCKPANCKPANCKPANDEPAGDEPAGESLDSVVPEVVAQEGLAPSELPPQGPGEPESEGAAPAATRNARVVGERWSSGARTWTEVGEQGLIHHVRFD